MNLFEAVSSGFRNYVNFSGRAVRSEYWYWTLFVTIVVVVFGVIDELLYPGAQMGAFSVVNMIISLAVILPGLAVSIRRLHDIDRTGWWLLLGLTIIGAFVLIYWACQRGTFGQNRCRRGDRIAMILLRCMSPFLTPKRSSGPMQ
jgi:uncharacterized membrane protein YhaH (DUF805 family)